MVDKQSKEGTMKALIMFCAFLIVPHLGMAESPRVEEARPSEKFDLVEVILFQAINLARNYEGSGMEFVLNFAASRVDDAQAVYLAYKKDDPKQQKQILQLRNEIEARLHFLYRERYLEIEDMPLAKKELVIACRLAEQSSIPKGDWGEVCHKALLSAEA